VTDDHARLFHYTLASCLGGILSAGKLVPAPEPLRRVRPVVFLSYHPDWDPFCPDMLHAHPTYPPIADRRELVHAAGGVARVGGGLARIEVDPQAAPHGWADYRRMSRQPNDVLRKLAQFAAKYGSDLRQWRVSFEPIGQELWRVVEIDEGEGWQPFPV